MNTELFKVISPYFSLGSPTKERADMKNFNDWWKKNQASLNPTMESFSECWEVAEALAFIKAAEMPSKQLVELHDKYLWLLQKWGISFDHGSV